MKTITKKSFIPCVVFISGFLLLAGSSCDSEKSAVGSATARTSVLTPVAKPPANSGLQEVVEKICQGQFEQANQILADQEDSEAITQLKKLLGGHDQLQQLRQQDKQAARLEQLDELEKIKEKVADKKVLDPNDIGETMLAVVRLREYALDDQKDEILSDRFVQKAMKQMQEQSDEYEQQGKWLDAYAHNYYWLAAMHRDNQSYKDKTEDLTELATIELAFKDSSCGETAKERYEGIEVVMFLRALQLLENNYVKLIDYNEMAEQGIKRCLLIGTVLEPCMTSG